jgi:non-ribosomal peptide synthetase component F
MIRYFADRRITASFLPTPIGEALLDRLSDIDEGRLSLRLLLLGGDRLRRFAPRGGGFELINAYGPTENAVVATAGTVGPKNTFFIFHVYPAYYQQPHENECHCRGMP